MKLLSTLSTDIEKATSQKAETKGLELAASDVRAEAEAEAEWKSRETDIMESKMNLENKKAEVEPSILRLQEKGQLLLTRKWLLDTGISLAKIDATFSNY